MKTLFFLLMFCAVALAARAAVIPVGWNPSAFAVSYEATRTVPGTTNPVERITVTATNCVFQGGVPLLTNVIVVEAITAQGLRSGLSTNFYVPVPDPPAGLRVGQLIETAPRIDGPWTTQSMFFVATLSDRDPEQRFARSWLTISRSP
jgi:hypothetical protein